MSDVSSDDECPDLIPVPERPVASDEPAYKIPVTIITGFLGKIVHIFLLKSFVTVSLVLQSARVCFFSITHKGYLVLFCCKIKYFVFKNLPQFYFCIKTKRWRFILENKNQYWGIDFIRAFMKVILFTVYPLLFTAENTYML